MEYPDVKRKLEALAAPFPYRDGFHLGMRDNQNAVELEVGQMLYGAMCDRRPTSVVELGTAAGYSATWMLLGLERNEHGHLWTLDPTVPQPAVWDRVGCPVGRLTYIEAISQDVEALAKLPPQIDFLFHDASHDFNSILKDVEMLIPRIPVGGLIAIHDVNFHRAMGDRVLEYFDSRPDDWKYAEMSMSCGLGVAERLRVPEPEKKTRKRRVKTLGE